MVVELWEKIRQYDSNNNNPHLCQHLNGSVGYKYRLIDEMEEWTNQNQQAIYTSARFLTITVAESYKDLEQNSSE